MRDLSTALRALLFALLFATAAAVRSQSATNQTEALPHVGVAIIKTSQIAVAEGLLVPGAGFSKKVASNFSAFLIKHHDDYLLFDTGLGESIDGQYQQGMPMWWRPFFGYDKPVVSARAQLNKAGFGPIRRVILSHTHWDHASGVLDFPEAAVEVSAEELALIRQPSRGPGGTWASQISSDAIKWQALKFLPQPYKGYPESLDLYQDGTVVLVPMPGHTPGSVGLFVRVDSGVQYFFIGDVAWSAAALRQGASKFWWAGQLVDADAARTLASVERVRALMESDRDLVVVPAHDSATQDALGYFPVWVR